MSAPVADSRETNSSSRPSTSSASMVPSVDMVMESWRSSSSSSRFHTLPPYCSPSASMSAAPRSGPESARFFCPDDWRLASAATMLSMSLVGWAGCADIAVRSAVQVGGLGGLLVQPLADDGDGFVRVLVGEVADFLHRLGVHLALHLGDIDHLGGGARFRLELTVLADLRHAGKSGRQRQSVARRRQRGRQRTG